MYRKCATNAFVKSSLGSHVATRFPSLPHPPLSLPLSPPKGLVSFVLMLRTIDVAHHLLNHQWTSQLMDHFSSLQLIEHVEFPKHLIMVHLCCNHRKEPITWVPKHLFDHGTFVFSPWKGANILSSQEFGDTKGANANECEPPMCRLPSLHWPICQDAENPRQNPIIQPLYPCAFTTQKKPIIFRHRAPFDEIPKTGFL